MTVSEHIIMLEEFSKEISRTLCTLKEINQSQSSEPVTSTEVIGMSLEALDALHPEMTNIKGKME